MSIDVDRMTELMIDQLDNKLKFGCLLFSSLSNNQKLEFLSYVRHVISKNAANQKRSFVMRRSKELINQLRQEAPEGYQYCVQMCSKEPMKLSEFNFDKRRNRHRLECRSCQTKRAKERELARSYTPSGGNKIDLGWSRQLSSEWSAKRLI